MFCKVYRPVWNTYPKGSQKHWLPRVQLSRMINLKIGFAKNKCMCINWSTEMIPIARTYPAREHYKNAYVL